MQPTDTTAAAATIPPPKPQAAAAVAPAQQPSVVLLRSIAGTRALWCWEDADRGSARLLRTSWKRLIESSASAGALARMFQDTTELAQ